MAGSGPQKGMLDAEADEVTSTQSQEIGLSGTMTDHTTKINSQSV